MNAPIDVTHIRIETERLILRPWRQEDLQDLFAYSSDPAVAELAGWPALQSLEEAQDLLDLFRKEPVFALELKQTGTVIGSLGIDWLDPIPELDNVRPIIFSYDLHRAFWGRGLMPEAVQAVIPYCFDKLYADCLYIGALSQNRQSQRVAEKCGFVFRTERAYPIKNGAIETERVYLLYNPGK